MTDTENIESDGPSEAAETEWEVSLEAGSTDEDVKDIAEATVRGMTGGMGVAASLPGYTTGGITHTHTPSTGGIIGPPYPGFSGYPPTSPSSGSIWATPKTAPADKTVDLPKKVTKKVLIAFVDDDGDEDTIVWAANLELVEVQMELTAEKYDDPTINLKLSLRDVYGNREED